MENTAKSIWTLSQQATWLGFDLDLKVGLISVLKEKIAVLKAQLLQVFRGLSVKARTLASVIGKIIAMSLAIGPVACLMTRSMCAILKLILVSNFTYFREGKKGAGILAE